MTNRFEAISKMTREEKIAMLMKDFDAEETIKKTVEWIKTQLAPNQGVVIGASGGVDSAVAIRLFVRAGIPVLAIMKPTSYNATIDVEYAGADLDAQGFTQIIDPNAFDWEQYQKHPFNAYIVKPITDALVAMANVSGFPYHSMLNYPLFRFPIQNYAARFRAAQDYLFANALGWKVAGTDHATEAYVGFFTKFGDGAFDFSPLSRRIKLEIWEIGRKLDVYQPIIDRVPTAGLWEGQTDEKEFGTFDYLDISMLIRFGTSGNAQADADIEAKHKATAHKRRMPEECPF